MPADSIQPIFERVRQQLVCNQRKRHRGIVRQLYGISIEFRRRFLDRGGFIQCLDVLNIFGRPSAALRVPPGYG
jgi:hypothetical protein